MRLSTDVIMDFVKVTNDVDKTPKSSSTYGTAVNIGGRTYVQLDGASNDQLLPVSQTAEVRPGERVMVQIKNHTAVAVGNTSSPAARVGTVEEVNSKVLNVDRVIAHEITADEVDAVYGFIDNIESKTINTGKLTADELAVVTASIETLRATYIEGEKLTVDKLEAANATIENLKTTMLACESLEADSITAIVAEIDNLHSKHADIEKLSAIDATIKYADIDFSRIDEAVLEELYAKSGLIENVTISDGYITGMLAGVTIKGDLIEGNTIVADKLVIKGDDGLYYKLNTFGVDCDGNTHGIEYVETDQEVDYVEYIETSTEISLYYYVETEEVLDIDAQPDHAIDATTLNGNTVREYDSTYYTVVNDECIKVLQYVAERKDLNFSTNNGNRVVFAKGVEVEDYSFYHIYHDELHQEFLVEQHIKGFIVDNAVTTNGNAVWRANDSDTTQYFTIRNHKAYLVEAQVISITAEQTEYNSLDGSIITAKSIVAEQIRADDLIAFDATIGGFVIDGNPQEEDGIGHIHSVGKESVDNSIPGLYLDSLGQVNIGDSDNFIKYVRNENGTYSLAISANSIVFSIVDEDGNLSPRSLSSLGSIGEYIRITTYEGEPCIELGESDSAFKLFITNKRILFMDGNVCPAYVTNQALHIDKAVVDNELQFGQFIWKKRDNGNMGIIWTDEEASE